MKTIPLKLVVYGVAAFFPAVFIVNLIGLDTIVRAILKILFPELR